MIILSGDTASAESIVSKSPSVLLCYVLLWGLIIAIIYAVIRSNKKKKTQRVQLQQEAKGSVAERLEALNDLLEKGIITQEEFDTKKKQLLGL